MSPEAESLTEFIRDIHPLNRSICSPDFDRALEIVREKYVPELMIDTYRTGSSAWSWTLPQKWTLSGGSLKCDGKTVISTVQEPLCVWSGSLPVSGTLSLDQLRPHLYADAERPELLCWYFRYYGNLDWGFNIPYNLLKTLPQAGRYEARIDAGYEESDFRIGYAHLKGDSPYTVLLTADICHPYQCNDSLTGAAINVLLYQKLKARKTRLSYIFSFVPETIGTIALLANHTSWIPNILYSFYSEFWGRKGRVRLQHSLRGNSLLDRACRDVLSRFFGSDFTELPFREDGVMNDERVTMLANLWIPSVALNRGMFREYHSNLDTPERIDVEALAEGYAIVEQVVDELEKNAHLADPGEKGCLDLSSKAVQPVKDPRDFSPRALFIGPLFLSRYQLWVDWRTEPELNAALDLIMAFMDGRNSVSEIAAFVRLPFDTVYEFVARLLDKKLVERTAR